MKVVVSGIGMVSSRGLGAESNWNSLFGPQAQLVVEGDDFLHVSCLQNSVFATPAFLRRRDRFTLLLVESLKQAIDQAILTPPLNGDGLVVESTLASWNTLQKYTQSLVQAGPAKVNPSLFTNVSSNASQGQAAILFGLTGPVSMMQGGGGLAYSLQMVRAGRANRVFTVAADEYNDLFYQEMLSDVYSSVGAGTLFAEGSCCLLLESEDSARLRGVPVYAEMVDAVVCSEGLGAKTFFDADPNGESLAYAWQQLLERNGLDRSDIGALFTAANGIPAFDLAEQRALHRVFGLDSHPVVCPTKKWFGEMLGTSSYVATTIAVYALQQGHLPFSGSEPRGQALPLDYCIVNTWDPPGTISTILLRRYDAN